MGTLVLAALPLAVRAADEKPEPKRTISVTGRGEVTVPPDRVVLSFGVETMGPRAGESAAENNKRSTAVVTAVKSLLAPEDTVTTSRYAVEPQYEPAQPGKPQQPRITGYLVRNEVQIETRRVDRVGSLIDAASGAGANRISGLRFTVADRAAALRTAIEQAGADAHAQAESVARGLGVRLKGVISANVAPGPVPVPRRFEAMGMVAEARVAPTPIEPGELTVPAALEVTYEIE